MEMEVDGKKGVAKNERTDNDGSRGKDEIKRMSRR